MSNETLKIFKLNAIPSTWEANSTYYIANQSNADLVEIYITSKDNGGTVTVRRNPTETDIKGWITDQVGAATEILVVADIAARDALTLTAVRYVFVKDATGDTTVTSRAAAYLYDPAAPANARWHKMFETESLDFVLNWEHLLDKPTSSVADIDDAVSKRHVHANKAQIDKIGEDTSGRLTYDGNPVAPVFTTSDW